MTSDFVHLHVHTEYSLLDGQSKIDKLVERAKQLDMPAVGISDHGVMFGVIDFYRKAKSAGIKPVVGMEAYLAPRSRFDKDPQLDKRPYHLLLWAKNKIGYKNLLKIASVSQLEGYYYRPRVDKEFLADHAEGIIATSGCLAAEIPRIMDEKGEEEAKRQIGWYQDVFGAENFFLEVQPHDIAELHTLNKWLFAYRQSGHTPVQLMASNDMHYVRVEDTDSHDTLLCIQTSALKNETNRMQLTPLGSYFMKSADQMRESFKGAPPELIQEAFANTLKIADMCDINLEKDQYHLPIFPVPEGFTEAQYFHHLCEIGLRWRFPNRENDPIVRERLEREIKIIGDMGFNTYFLIVWDLCEFARSADIWWNVRGSGAGSLVAYCLGITNLDPILNSLLFERFLNPGRISMPDIDLDYPDNRRGEMIAYTVEKYGEDKVAAIITFGTMGAKAAVKDVARAMDVSLVKVTQAVKLIPQEAKQREIQEYIDADPDLKKMYQNDSELRRVLDTAMQLQGTTRHASMHAAGVIVSDTKLVEYVPLHRITGNTDSTGGSLKAVTQFDMETAESLGLLKVDFLGLSTLTILRKACELVEKHHGIHYDMDNIPYRHDDENVTDEQRKMLDETFKLLGRGETIGVFQLESGGMQSMLRDMRPFKFEHVIAGISLYRPGPMDFIPLFNRRMRNDEVTTYHHSKLETILGETYGIMVYQEQLMQIAGELFNYKLGEADLMRRAVSKKKEKDLLEHRAFFRERGPDNGIDIATADKIFDDIVFFANYGFNKSHASDYAVITVQSAYLKTHYPHEYMTALLCVQFDDSTKVATFLEECRRLHIPVLPPDVNFSDLDFDIEQMQDGRRSIRFGLGAVKNAGVGVLKYMLEKRAEGGVFTSLVDFCERVDLRTLGRKALESLIKVGALSQFGERDAMVENLERIIQFSIDHHKAKESGQKSLFGDISFASSGLEIQPAKEPVPHRLQLGWEKELLGLYVTGRPVDRYKDSLRHLPLAQISALKDPETIFPNEKGIQVAGEIVNLRKIITKNGDPMVVLQLEDWHDSAGSIEVVLFPKTWSKVSAIFQEEHGKVLDAGEIVLVRGKFDNTRNDPQIIAEMLDTNFDVTTGNGQAQHHNDEMPAWAIDSSIDNDYPPMDFDEETGEIGSSQEPPPNFVPSVASSMDNMSNYDTPWLEEKPVEITGKLFDDDAQVASRRVIRVHFHSVLSADKDRQRLKRVMGTFKSFPGDDQYEIFVHYPRKIQTWVSEVFRVGYSNKLLEDLQKISGLDKIDVQMI